jgi:predicted ferric reductase
MARVTLDGLGARASLVRWGLGSIAAGAVIGATLPDALHGLALAWDANRMALPWLVERVFAFLAYLAMTGSVVYGLLLSTRLPDTVARRPITYSLHQDLAAFGVAFAAVHGMLLALDRSVGFSLAQILVPGLSPYEPVAVAFGQVALYLAIVVMASFYLRRRIGQRAWRSIHSITFLVFLGATVHGIAAGSDSGAPWARWLYVGSAAVVAFLVAYRVALAVAARTGHGRPMRAQAELTRIRGRAA